MRLIPIILFAVIILLSGFNDEIFSIMGFSLYEVVLLILFFFTFAHSVIIKNNYFFNFNSLDKYFFIFFISVSVFPLVANVSEFLASSNPDIKEKLYLFRLYIVYSILTYIFLIQIKKGEIYYSKYIKLIFEYIVIFGLLSGIIGILRFIPGSLNTTINSIWPLGKEIVIGQRMLSTVGSINTGGIFFTIMCIICLYLYKTQYKKKYIILFSLHSLFVLLTGSLSAIGTYFLTISFMISKLKLFQFKTLVASTIIFLIFVIIFNFELIRNIFNSMLIERLIFISRNDVVIPANLTGRYEDWVKIIGLLWILKPLFGWGFKETELGLYADDITVSTARITLSENFYIELLLYSGLLGLLVYIYLVTILIKINSNNSLLAHTQLIYFIIIAILISQITQLSTYYSTIMELVGLLMALVFTSYKLRFFNPGMRISG